MIEWGSTFGGELHVVKDLHYRKSGKILSGLDAGRVFGYADGILVWTSDFVAGTRTPAMDAKWTKARQACEVLERVEIR